MDLDDLLERARQQDMRAWDALYAKTHDALYRRVRFMTGDPSTAEEITQETYVQAMLSIADFRAEASFPTWLSAVALNLVRKHWRRQGAKGRAHAGLQLVRSVLRADARQPEENLSAKREEQALTEAVEGLPTKLREVFVLRHLEGLSCPEVAELLDISENNVSVRAYRARARVREALTKQGILESEEGT